MAIIKSTSSLSAPPKKVNIGKFFASSQKKVQTAKVKQSSDALRNELVAIRDNVIKIDNLVRSNLIFQRKVSSDNRKNKEGEERSKREKKLESYKSKLPGVEFPVLPRFDFIESIKRFIFFTFLGAAFPKLIELVPKLVNFAKIISPAVNFFADAAKGLLNGLVTFIDWGYQIRDNTQKIAKQIGGENAEKKFNEFNRTLNTFIDLSILAGLTALDVGLDAERFRREQLKKKQQKPPRGRVGVTEGKGGAKGLGRAAVTTGRGGDKKLGRGARVTGSGVDKGPLSKLKGPFAKLKGPLSKFAGAAVPGLGAVVGAADARARFAAGDNVGGTLASISATLDTLVAGSAILAATGIGAAVPAAFATVSMGIDAVLLIRDIIKAFFPQLPMFVGGGRIRLMAQGGRVGSPGRSIKVSRKKLPIGKPQDTRPGKDVGGKQQILKLFPDGSPENIRQTTSASPWWARLFGRGNNQNTPQPVGGKRPSPLKAIENTSKSLKKIPIPFISALMGAGSDVNLGQKPDKNLGDIVGGSIGKLTQDIIDNNMKLSFSDIVRFVSGYANGGDVRSGNIIKENDIGYQVGSMVSKVISTAISSRVDEAINGILREITGQGKPLEGEDGEGGAIGGEFDEIGIGSDEMDLLKRLVYAEAGGEGKNGMALVARSVLNRAGLIQSGKASPGTFSSTSGSITDIIRAPKQYTPVSNGRIRQRLTVSQLNQALEAIRLAQNPTQLINNLKSEGLNANTISKLIAATGFRNYSAGAGYDPSQDVNEINYKRHTFNTAGNTSLLVPRGVAIKLGGIEYVAPDKNIQISVSSRMGWRNGKMHEGSDITAKEGTPLRAVSDGRIVDSGVDPGGWGNFIVYKDDKGIYHLYGHLQNGYMRGGNVKKGDIIAKVGMTGRTTGPHLHWETGTGWTGGVITNRFDPLNRYSQNAPFFTARSNNKKPQPEAIKPTGRVIRSVDLGGNILTEREGKVFTLNGQVIDKSRVEVYKRNFKEELKDFNVSTAYPLSPSKSMKNMEGLKFNPSYDEGTSSMVAIQLVNRTTIVSETA